MTRSLLLSGFAAFAALAAVAAAPAHPDPLMSGGVTVPRGGYNHNLAKGKFSAADQAITTIGGTASNHDLTSTRPRESRCG